MTPEIVQLEPFVLTVYKSDEAWDYGALKEYAYKYFKKTGKDELAELYRAVFNAWMEAFRIKTNEDAMQTGVRARIASLLESAYENEKEAVLIMETMNHCVF